VSTRPRRGKTGIVGVGFDQPVVTAIVALAFAVVASGCGSAKGNSQDEAAIRATVGEFLDGWEKANGARVCSTMTPSLAARASREVTALKPRLRGQPCQRALMAFWVPAAPSRPAAADEAGNWNYGGIHVDGSRATVRFSDGGHWSFVKSGTRWLIADMPISPRATGSTS
jgi:hypothetical protein